MPLVSFSKPGQPALYFSVNPVYPGRLEINSGGVTGKTEGGRTYVYRKGPGFVLHILTFEDMPVSDFDNGYDYAAATQEPGLQNLVNWFFNVAPPGTGFTYSDHFGGTHTVEFMDAELKFALTDYGRYSGTLRLKEVTG